MSRKTILVVDDDTDVRDTIADVLSDEGYVVASAADGLEGLEWLRQNPPPGVVLLDWMMPRCDAAGFRERQLAEPAIASVPVVLLTADAQAETKNEEITADAYLMKPVKLERLLEMVRRFCG